MISLLINNVEIPLPKDTKIRWELKNPLVSEDPIPGEHSLPFTLNSSTLVEVRLAIGEHLIDEDLSFSYPATILEDGIPTFIGVAEFDLTDIDRCQVNMVTSNSTIAAIKDLKLSEIISQTVAVGGGFQTVYVVGDGSLPGNVGYIRVNIFMGPGGTFAVGPYATLAEYYTDLADQINLHPGLSSYVYAIDAVTSLVITAISAGITPYLNVGDNWPGPGANPNYWAITGNDVAANYNYYWNLLMQDANANPDDYNYCFFPVVGSDDKYQNFYDPISEEFKLLDSSLTHPFSYLTPFIYLRFVLDQICAKVGWDSAGSFRELLDTFRVVIYNNRHADAEFQQWPGFGTNFSEFLKLENHLPDQTVAEFLRMICDTFCIAPIPEPTNRVIRWTFKKDALQKDAQDWSDRLVRWQKLPNLKVGKFTFSYNDESTDDLYSAYLDAFGEAQFVGDFPDTTNLPILQSGDFLPVLAFITDGNELWTRPEFAWEERTEDNLFYGFSVTGVADSEVTVEYNGAGSLKTEVYQPGITLGLVTRQPHVEMPMAVYNENFANAPCALRLLIFHGMVEYPGSFPLTSYPFASNDGIDADANELTDYSLMWHTDRGRYNQFFKAWTIFWRDRRPVEGYFKFSLLDIITVDYSRPVFINGSKFIIEQLNPELPVTKEILVKLLQIK